MQNRIEKAKDYVDRLFISEDFKDPKKSLKILEDIVLKTIPAPKKVSLELLPCYEAPLLSPSEELHLFRQMNYFKYKAKVLLETKITPSKLKKIEFFVDKAKKVRNRIAESNFRLATQLLKHNVNYYRENSLIDSLLSDAYYDILKSVDYFDWTRGHKFSTYATWVVKKNFFRDSKEKQKKSDKITRIDDAESYGIFEAKSNGIQDELDYESQKKLVKSLLTLLKHGNCTKDQSRQVFILENYFGLNDNDSHTLDELSQKLHITKERVRQLKEKALKWLKLKIKNMNLDYESCIENFRYS